MRNLVKESNVNLGNLDILSNKMLLIPKDNEKKSINIKITKFIQSLLKILMTMNIEPNVEDVSENIASNIENLSEDLSFYKLFFGEENTESSFHSIWED